jgi:hypothetical protein
MRNLQTNSTIWWRVKSHNAIGWSGWSFRFAFTVKLIPTQVKVSAIPKAFSFSVSSRTGFIRYALPKAEHVLLRIYSVNGQLQSEAVNMQQNAGYYNLNLQRSVAASGAYLVVFRAGEYYQKKMIFLMS